VDGFGYGGQRPGSGDKWESTWLDNRTGSREGRVMVLQLRFIVWSCLLCGLLTDFGGGTARAAALADSPFGAVFASAEAAREPGDPTKGNRLATISGGYDALLLRVHLIRQAKVSVSIQTFIWTNDDCGRLLIYELIEAARRGVRVRILADHMVSEQDPATMAFLATAHPKLEVKHYRPAAGRIRPSWWRKLVAGAVAFRDTNQRMHNKVFLVDDVVLVTGGRNVENTYFDHSTSMNFRDRDVVAVGPVVRGAVESFEQFWRYREAVTSRALKDVGGVIESGNFRRYETKADYDFGPHFVTLTREADDAGVVSARFVARLKPVRAVTFISDEPGKLGANAGDELPRITRALRTALEQAKTSIVVQSPYLVLSKPARALIREMQAKNPELRIRISTNSFASTDNLFAYSANYRLRNDYVEELRLEVHEFKPLPGSLLTLFPRHPEMAEVATTQAKAGKPVRPPFMCVHAKSLVVDGRLAFVGSYNLDPRSERLNTEVGLLVEDEAFARELCAEIERDMLPENSWVIGRRVLPLRLEAVNKFIDDALSLGPIDVWPFQNTSSFELNAGAPAVAPGHQDFHRHYRDVGPFPGTEGLLSTKEILTRLYKAVGAPLTPIL
jgi:phosphatidylserine/phosphatidylglycerophosphate/cardiolipin synthase-like enzyme